MQTKTFVLLHFAFALFVASRGEHEDDEYIYYKSSFVTMNSVSPNDFPNATDRFKVNKHQIAKNFKEKYQALNKQQHVSLSLSNLFALLKGIQKKLNCLILIDNWQSADVQETAAVPIILRKLEAVLYMHTQYYFSRDFNKESKYLHPVLLPSPSKYTNKTFETTGLLHCPTPKYFYPLEQHNLKITDVCVDLIHDLYVLISRPWQCKIQVSLLMPEILLKDQYFPGIFQYNYSGKLDFMPGSRPKLHMFLNSRSVQDYNSIDLLNWIANYRLDFFGAPQFKSPISAQNFVYISGQIICKGTNIFITECEIETLSHVSYCMTCLSLIKANQLKQNDLSFEQIRTLDKIQEQILWPGQFICYLTHKQFSLCKQMPFFQTAEPDANLDPLKFFHNIKTKYSDKIQILAFAYTSVLKVLLGNSSPVDDKFNIFRDANKKTRLLIRQVKLHEFPVSYPNAALQVENKFASLRFVSCGSRGLENLQFEQFLAVFDCKVWYSIIASGIISLMAMNLLRGNRCWFFSFDKILCLVKVLLEQGDAFRERLVKTQPFRFLICGTILGGLVLSNAFKNTNVYNIMLPQKPLPFRTFEELLSHGYHVYTKIAKISYNLKNVEHVLEPIQMNIFENAELEAKTYKGHEIFFADTEIYRDSVRFLYAPEKLVEKEMDLLNYLYNNTWPHPGLYQVFVEPLDLLRPLVQIGSITLDYLKRSALKMDLWKNQREFILVDLKKCNKSAWVLPDYEAQQMKRLLYLSGKYADVGVDDYFRFYLNLVFRGPVTPSLILKASLVHSSGLLGWWSNLINRTDLIIEQPNKSPIKPSMSGNIRVIFIFLGTGLLLAQGYLVLELHKYIKIFSKYMWHICKSTIKMLVRKLNYDRNLTSLEIVVQSNATLPCNA